MNKMIDYRLDEIAKIDISSIDKRIKVGEKPVRLCNFTDVYKNWAITSNMAKGLMEGSANESEIERFSLKKGMIAITKDSETREDIGISTYIADDLDNTVLGYHTALIIPDESKVDGAYLNGYLQSNRARTYFSNQASGSGQRYTLTISGIGAIKVPLPSLHTQNMIGNLLLSIDKKIKTNNAINDNLSELLRSLYEYWFIQLEFPSINYNHYKSEGGKTKFSNKLQRLVPEVWRVAKVKDVIQHINTGLNPRDNFVLNDSNEVKYITVKNLTTTGVLDFTSCDYISSKTKKLINQRSLIDKGDILFASIAPLGRCYLIQETPVEWEINESVFSIRPNNSCVSSEYLYLFFTSQEFIRRAEHSSTGSVFSGIRVSVLENMDILIPTEEVMSTFVEKVEPLFKQQFLLQQEINRLSILRDWLLPLLMNGQVTIAD